MSESTELKSKLCQNASNNDLVKNKVQIEINGDLGCDEDSVQNGIRLIRPDVDNCKTIESTESNEKSESEPELDISGSNGNNGSNGTTGMTRVSQLNGVDGMRNIHTNSNSNSTTQAPDVCSGSQQRDTYDGVDGMREEPSQDSLRAHISSSSISALPDTNNEVLIIETVVKTNSNEVTLITDTTVRTTSHSSDQTLNQSSNDCSSESTTETNNQNKTIDSNAMTTTTTSRPKQLKSLLKRASKEISINRNNEKRRVRFSETMQVFCDDWPQDLMPQIIALKSPTDFNLVEVQGYMFEPPVEYQDFLPFEPPPDYRDFIANSLCAFDSDLSINYIDDEEDDDSSKAKIEQKFLNEFSSKWESMILDNSESLEEEQIIGVLKEDAILQAIGSHVSLPEEQLCPEDFPIHFPNKDNSYVKLADSELSDITSEDGNDSSPTGSLQDIQSDSSITSQDTIILINSDSNDNNINDSNDKMEVLSNKNCFNDIETPNDEEFDNSTDSESVVNRQTETDDKSTKSDTLDDRLSNESNSETVLKSNESLVCEESNQNNFESNSGKGIEAEVDSAPDVRQDIERREVQTSETHGSDSNLLDCELNDETKQLNLYTSDETTDLQTNHSNAFKRNLMFYENMFSDKNIKTDVNSKADKPIKQSHTVTHFVIQNNSKFPIITQMISNFNNNNNNISNSNENSVPQTNERSVEAKQLSNDLNGKAMNNTNSCQTLPAVPARAPVLQPTQQTQPNSNNWSTDEFIIEYTSEPRALVPSKRTASLSNFATAQMSANPPMIPIRSNANNSNIQYLSLNRNGELSKQWNAYNTIDSHNSSQQIRYQYPPNQRSLSPNPPMGSSANTRPVSPQQVYFQNRAQTQYNPRFPSNKTMPVHVTYNRMPGPQHRVSIRPVMSQTLGPPHKQPPPYHYHIQQHSNEFPNPSEIRRRDGLNAYPHVLNQTPQAGALPVPPIHHNNNQNNLSQTLSKDELEQFVQQDIQRTERIKKRYSMSEEDDPSFGFARRPSVRGIRPKFGTTNEILKQMQTPNNNSAIGSQMPGSHVSWPQNNNTLTNNNNNNSNNQIPTQHKQSFHKKPQIVQLRHPMSVKQYVSEVSAPDPSQLAAHPQHTGQGPAGVPMSRTLPRPSSLITQSQMNAIRTEDGLVIRVLNTSRDQLKQQIQRQLEQQLQPKLKQKMTQMSSNNVKPVVMSSNDERGAPEGASSSPKHSSDLLFAKNLNSNSNSNPNSCSGETTVNNKTTNRQQTNDTKRLVINEDNSTNSTNNKVSDDSEGVIYYSMNV